MRGEKAAVKGHYSVEQLLKQQHYNDVNFMNALVKEAGSNQDSKFWDQIEANFLSYFELAS